MGFGTRWRRVAVLAAAVAGVAACLTDEPGGPAPPASASLLVRADLAASAAATVVLQVSASDIAPPLTFNIPITDSLASGTVTIPAGSARTITLTAYDAGGTATHRGAVTVDILPGVNPQISIVLQPLTAGVPITGTLGSYAVTIQPGADTLGPGDTAALRAVVLDANAQPVSGQVAWGAVAPAVARIIATGDQTARVTAVAVGQTTVTATYGGTTGLATIVVGTAQAATPTLLLVAQGLGSALYVAAPPGDSARAFVVQQNGEVQVLRHDTLLATPFLDLRGTVNYGGETGLLSIAFHPHYAQNGRFYVDYVDASGTIQVVRYQVSAADPDVAEPATAQVVLSIPHPASETHYGGLLMFGPDGYLYIGTGDGGPEEDPFNHGQDSTTLLGRILRIDVDGAAPYAIPPTNPFVGRPPAAPEIWAYGLRNPWRFAFDAQTGALYIADDGQEAWEEVDVQPAASAGGQNYGWNTMEGAHCFNPATGCNTTGLVPPSFEYSHGVNDANGCAIIGGFVYRGRALPSLVGRYLFADLCAGWIKSFRWQGGVATDLVDHTPQLGAHPYITSFGQDGRGEVYITLLTGEVYRIVPR